jgi:uncharacterized protein
MNKLLTLIIFALLVTVFVQGFYILQDNFLNVENKNEKNSTTNKQETPKPLLAYTFENLKDTIFPASEITLGETINETDEYVQRLFYFTIPARPEESDALKVSGLATIPKSEGEFPVIVMYRGFIPEDSFTSGAGTSPSAGQLASSGYITLAPDFLGFGESDKPSGDSFENRFQTYTTSLTLLESLENLNTELNNQYSGTISAKLDQTGLWGHSNGGHIALSTLAITGRSYPTVLWAPVSKSFPYSILYYTDESDDQGKAMRIALGNFEKLYDTAKFSPERYYKWIKAPIQINQGTADPEVPYWWSDELIDVLEEQDLEIEYNTYPGANHNLQPSWNEAVANTIDFYNSKLK